MSTPEDRIPRGEGNRRALKAYDRLNQKVSEVLPRYTRNADRIALRILAKQRTVRKG